MGRVLFVVPPLVGHINPTVATAAALTERGHTVAWAGHGELVRHLAGEQALVYECDSPEGGLSRTAALKGPAALQFLWEDFLIPLGDEMAPGVHRAIDEFEPEIVVSDQQTVAGGLIADSRGLTWVTSATTPAELINPLDGLPKVAAWLDGLLDDLRGRIAKGLGSADPRMSPHGVLGFTTQDLLGSVRLPDHVWLVGPSLAQRPDRSDFPWEWFDSDLPTVLVTLGTANLDASADFLAEATKALAAMAGQVRGIVLDPGGTVGDPEADNVLVRRDAPQLSLLREVDAVVCHGGHNTVCEALWHGVPLVVAPIRDDQPIVAGQIVNAGAGVRLRFTRSNAQRIANAIRTVLDDAAGYRAAAESIGRAFEEAGGNSAAARRLEGLLPAMANTQQREGGR